MNIARQILASASRRIARPQRGVSTLVFLVLMSCLAVAHLGCADEDGSLSGSLGDYYDLSFEHARARLYSSEFAIEYVASDGQVPVRVSVKVVDGAFQKGTYNLKERGDITGQRGDSRIPRFLSGTLKITDFNDQDGARIKATFNATFQTGRDKSALEGKVDTTLEIVEGTRGYEFDSGADAGDAVDEDVEDVEDLEGTENNQANAPGGE